MNEENIKNSIKVFEFAFKESFKTMQLGLKELVELGNKQNVIHFKNIANDDQEGKSTLLAAQGIPGIVNLSLSIEMALKLILLQSLNTKKSTHNLEVLFFELPVKIQEKIRDGVVKEINANVDDFYEKLGENKLGFVNWRYFYENTGNSAGTDFLQIFFKETKKQINW